MKTRKEAKKEIKQLWNQLVDIFKDSYDINEFRLRIKLVKKLPEIVIDHKQHRNKTPDLKITYNGKSIIIKDGKGADTLVDFIRCVGVEFVYKLELPLGKNLLVERNKLGLEDKNPKPLGDYYVLTKIGNRDKHSLMNEIISRASFDAKVEFV